MSIQSEIDRLALAKDDLADAITSKGVTVPQGAKLDSYPALVLQIETGGGAQILCGATDAVSVPSYDSVNVALPGVPSSYHLVVGFEVSQDGNQDTNIFLYSTGAQLMDGQWHAKAYNYGDTIQGKLTWVAFP